VRALARSSGRGEKLAAGGVQLVIGDLHDETALSRLVQDSAWVIHAAGAVRGNSRQDFDRVNVDGTAALLRAIDACPNPPKLLLLSSLAAREPQLSWYAASKRAGEVLVEDSAGLDWLILRPPAVYGPGDREMRPIFQTMARGFAAVPGSVQARLSLIHVRDLVEAIVACLASNCPPRQTLTLCDGKPGGYSWVEMAATATEVFDRRVRLWPVPGRLLDTFAAVNSALAHLSRRPPMLTPPKVRELRHPDWVADNAAINAATGWTPAIGLREGLSQLEL